MSNCAALMSTQRLCRLNLLLAILVFGDGQKRLEVSPVSQIPIALAVCFRLPGEDRCNPEQSKSFRKKVQSFMSAEASTAANTWAF
jgi:hypothetical protein